MTRFEDQSPSLCEFKQPEREGAEVFEEATSCPRKKTGKRPDSLEPEQVGDNENIFDDRENFYLGPASSLSPGCRAV